MAVQTNSQLFLPVAAASVATPATGVVKFLDAATGHLSQKDSAGVVTDLAASVGSSPPQIDLSSYSGADVALALGQNAIYTFNTAITSLPLKIACADNQSYKIEGFFTREPASADSQIILSPNNTTLGTSIRVEILFAQNPSTLQVNANGGFASGLSTFQLSANLGKTYNFSALVNTKTNGKSVVSESRQQSLTADALAKSSSLSDDTTTVWSSLGTITFPTGYAGRVVVTKLSDASAGGGVPGIITGGPADAVQVNSSSVLAGYSGLTYNDNKGLALAKAFVLAGDITPASLTADTNDYDPTGFATAYTVRLSSNNNWYLTGLAAGINGEMKQLINIGTNHITIVKESADSVAANRINGDIVLTAEGGSCRLRYDTISSRWIIIGSSNCEETIYSQVFAQTLLNPPLF